MRTRTVHLCGIYGAAPELPFISKFEMGQPELTTYTGMGHLNPRYGAIAHNECTGKLYVISPQRAISPMMHLVEIGGGKPIDIASYSADDISGYGGSDNQLAANGAVIVDGMMFVLTGSTVFAKGRLVSIDLENLAMADMGEANLPFNNYRELVADDDGVLYAYSGNDIYHWTGSAFVLVGTPFINHVDSGVIGAGFWDRGKFYNIAQRGPHPGGPFAYYLLSKTLGGKTKAMPIPGFVGDMDVTDATLEI
jgi:hypothetical protein